MPSDFAYLDASAFFKLVLPEEESEVLKSAVREWRWISSALLEVEVVLAVRRRDPSGVDAARHAVAGSELIDIDPDIRRVATDLGDPPLRSLDAIHLATALSLGDHCAAFFAYDQRLIASARAHGLPVTVPQP